MKENNVKNNVTNEENNIVDIQDANNNVQQNNNAEAEVVVKKKSGPIHYVKENWKPILIGACFGTAFLVGGAVVLGVKSLNKRADNLNNNEEDDISEITITEDANGEINIEAN